MLVFGFVPFLFPSWRSLNLWKGHLTIPKRSPRIVRHVTFALFFVFVSWHHGFLVPHCLQEVGGWYLGWFYRWELSQKRDHFKTHKSMGRTVYTRFWWFLCRWPYQSHCILLGKERFVGLSCNHHFSRDIGWFSGGEGWANPFRWRQNPVASGKCQRHPFATGWPLAHKTTSTIPSMQGIFTYSGHKGQPNV